MATSAGETLVALRAPSVSPADHNKESLDGFSQSSIIITTAQGGQFWVSTGGQFSVVISLRLGSVSKRIVR